MKQRRFHKHIVYAVLSLVSPVIAFIATRAYQSAANSEFWNSLKTGDGESAAAVWGAMDEFAQLINFTMIGCIIGIIFALISLRIQRRILGFGLTGVVFNGLPLLLVIILLIRKWILEL